MKIIGQRQVIHYFNECEKRSRLAPSQIFTGPEGVGKKTVALELAKTFFCDNKTGPFPDDIPRCDDCGQCRRISDNNHPDVLLINKDIQAAILKEKSASQTGIKIEMIRNVDRFVQLKPLEGPKRVVIIEDAHILTDEAANALLKLLEEPNQNALMFLLTTTERALLPTIVSRCAIQRFRPISKNDMVPWLIQRLYVSEDLAHNLADESEGSFSKALAAMEKEEKFHGLEQFELDEFFELLSKQDWQKEGRQKTKDLIRLLLGKARKELEGGDLNQEKNIRHLLAAERQVARFVNARLVLQNLYIKTEIRKTT